jgi:hypothetical protein
MLTFLRVLYVVYLTLNDLTRRYSLLLAYLYKFVIKLRIERNI